MPPYRNFAISLAMSAIASVAAMACFSAAPSECIEAAEEAGLPDEVIEQLRNPGDLNAVERAALNRILSEAGIDDVCQIASNDEEPAETNKSSSGDKEPVESANFEERRETIEQTIAAAQRSARIPRNEEHRRRCQFWALNNLEPAVYEEFAELNPDSMDDLDRILWRTKLNPGNRLGFYDDDSAGGGEAALLLPLPEIYCRDYWAEPLSRSNADLRNHGFERSCRWNLEIHITQQYRRMVEAVNYREDKDNELVFQSPNQYVRILQWLDTSGDELVDSDNPPYRILAEQSEHLYAYIDNNHGIPSEADIENYERETDARLNLEWIGILAATAMAGSSSGVQECHYYYPQVFYGYWVPFDPDQMPSNRQADEIDLPRYQGAETPLYLPQKVAGERVRAGYPLGQTAGEYYLCWDSSETENAGYYYVDHPAGDYCEKMP